MRDRKRRQSAEIPTPAEIRSLATLLGSGISPADGCRKLAEHSGNTALWQQLAKRLEQGQSFHLACRLSGGFADDQLRQLALFEQTGRLDRGLSQLAGELETRTLWEKKVRGKLLYPFCIFLVAVLLATLMDFVKLPPAAAFTHALLNIGLLMLFWQVTRWLIRLLSLGCAFWLPLFWQHPGLRRFAILRKYQDVAWLGALAQQVEAGLDLATALNHLSGFVSSTDYQTALADAARALRSGHSYAKTLMESGLVFTQEAQRMLPVAEHTGDWQTSLRHQLNLLHQDIVRFEHSLSEWLPRGLYFLFILTALLIFRGSSPA